MATPRIFRSTDVGAPILTGEVGKLIGLLDSVLTNGYGNTPPLGWAKAFSGTNLAAYQQPAGLQMYLRVDDTTTSRAALTGYQTMTGISAGTNQFPSSNQVSARKSDTTDTVVRHWIIIGDAKTVYVFMEYLAGTYASFMFGDICTYKPSDQYSVALIGGPTFSDNSNREKYLHNIHSFANSSNPASIAGHFLAGTHDGLTLASAFLKVGGTAYITGSVSVTGSVLEGGLPYPNPTDNLFHLARLWVVEPNSGGALRGHLRGAWHWLHSTGSLANGDILVGQKQLDGRTFMIIRNPAVHTIELTDWDE